jgi:hypothetical protein
MKKFILSVAALTLSAAIFAQKTVAEVAKFSTDVIDQGKIKQNNPEEVKFIVTNISKEALIIEQANPTCGCTIGDYTKSPIPPGGTGFVSAKFNAANPGHFTKTMTVKFAGVDEVKNITITGDVLDADAYVKWQAENPAPVVKTQPAAAVAPAVTAKPAKAAKTVKAKKPCKGANC